MRAGCWLLLSIASLCCFYEAISMDVTRHGDIMSCSLLSNSATALRLDGSLQADSAPLKELSQLLVSRLQQSSEEATSDGETQVKYFPIVAVLGGSALFDTDVPGDEHVNMSPAIQTGNEMCFFAMPAGKENRLAAQCRPVCTSLQDSQVSISYHETQLGNLPFLFVGKSAQQYADCKEIIYPDFRTALGWMCKHRVNETGSMASSAFQIQFIPLSVILSTALVFATLLQ